MSPCDALAPVPLDRRRLMGGQRRSRKLVPGIRDAWLRAAGARLRASPAARARRRGRAALRPGRRARRRRPPDARRRGSRRKARRRSGAVSASRGAGAASVAAVGGGGAPGSGAQAAARRAMQATGRLGMRSFWASVGPDVSIRRAGWSQGGQGARGRRAMSESKDVGNAGRAGQAHGPQHGRGVRHLGPDLADVPGGPAAGGGVEASRPAEHLADVLRALPHDVGQPEAGRRQDHRVLGGAAAALAELDAEVARLQGGGRRPRPPAHAEGRQAVQPQGVVGERDLRLPQAVLPADLGLAAGHGRTRSARWTRRSAARRPSTHATSSRR